MKANIVLQGIRELKVNVLQYKPTSNMNPQKRKINFFAPLASTKKSLINIVKYKSNLGLDESTIQT